MEWYLGQNAYGMILIHLVAFIVYISSFILFVKSLQIEAKHKLDDLNC